ncbi:uncharacterized protein LOC102808152 [Saccoglossus kowalevskii]|uniref:Uncharacterized protein LOC102808152 n=1 Tax=Saccoglossus kowalevskii TaxID=10224 RepID=A0ABM0MM37_SACKO|nr:PREDICTED: uncharacterized protein LOC102808152 [Saccoglossus kowalevskii]
MSVERQPLSPLLNINPNHAVSPLQQAGHECPNESDIEDEIFFGEMTSKEQKKANKLKRRTDVFVPGFRLVQQAEMIHAKIKEANAELYAENKENVEDFASSSATIEIQDTTEKLEQHETNDIIKIEVVKPITEETLHDEIRNEIQDHNKDAESLFPVLEDPAYHDKHRDIAQLTETADDLDYVSGNFLEAASSDNEGDISQTHYVGNEEVFTDKAIENETTLQTLHKDLRINLPENTSQSALPMLNPVKEQSSYVYSSPILLPHTVPTIFGATFTPSIPKTPSFASPHSMMNADDIIAKYANSPVIQTNHLANNQAATGHLQTDVMAPVIPATTSNYDEIKERLIEQRRQLLAEKKARLVKIREERERLLGRLGMDLPKTSSPPPTPDALVKPPPPTHAGEAVTDLMKQVEINRLSVLKMDDNEMAVVTRLNTMHNREYRVHLSQIGNVCPPVVIRHIQHVTSPSKVQWQENLVTNIPDKFVRSKTSQVKEIKPILHQKPPDYVYPYNNEVPSPVVITRHRRTNMLSSPHTKPRLKY